MDGLFFLSDMPKIVLQEGGFFTPATMLAHEADHAVDEISSMGYYIVNPNNYREVQRIYDSDWDHLITSPNQMTRSVYVYFPNTGNTYYISKNGWRIM